MKEFFPSGTCRSPEKTEPAYWFVFRERKMLVDVGNGRGSPPFVRDIRDMGVHPVRELYLGMVDGVRCYAAEVEEGTNPPWGMAFHGLWGLHGTMEEELFPVAFKAVHTVEWDRTDQYCIRCGSKNRLKEDERAKECPRCGKISFPRISPAVIVLVEHEGKALLARSPRFKQGLFSTLAGFVEPGETLEEAVRREVREETGIQVDAIKYFGSQPWPFPDSLMIGFTAKYAGGEIKVDNKEILDARWFSADDMPEVPSRISISRALIDSFLRKARHRKGT